MLLFASFNILEEFSFYTQAINNDVVIVECSQWWMHLATSCYFTGKPLKLKETNIANEHFRLKNHNWREKRPVGYSQA